MLKYIKYKVWRCILQCCIDAIWIANVGETTEEAKVLDVGTSDAGLQNCTCMLIKHFCYKHEGCFSYSDDMFSKARYLELNI